MVESSSYEFPFAVTGLQPLPYSPLHGQIKHEKSAAGRDACVSASEIKFTDDLAKEAALLLQLLYEVDDAKSLALYSPEGMGVAAERYEQFWLPLLASHTNPASIAAPLDVAWAWLMHSLAPSRYSADFEAITGKPAKEIRAASAQNREAGAVARGQAAWEARYPKEPFEPPGPSKPGQPRAHGRPTFQSKITYSLVDAAGRQQVFLYQVNLPHWKDWSFLRQCVERYQKFLYLRRVHPEAFLVPTFDTDLVWHAHMACHFSYVRDVEKSTGRFFDHDDSINDRTAGAKLDVSYRSTKELWMETFDEEYIFSGGMYRGKLPGHSLLAAWMEHQKGALSEAAAIATNRVPNAEALRDIESHPRIFDITQVMADTSQGSIWRLFSAVDTEAASPETSYQLFLRSPAVPSAPSTSVSVLNNEGQLVAVSRIVGRDQLPLTDQPLQELSFPMLPLNSQKATPAMLIQRCDSSGGSDWGICMCERPYIATSLVEAHLFRLGREFYPCAPDSALGLQYKGTACFEGRRSRQGSQILRFSVQDSAAGRKQESLNSGSYRGEEGSCCSCFGETRPGKRHKGKLLAEIRLGSKQQIVVGPGEEAPCALALGGSICLQAAFLSSQSA